jgi:hypothetical protein
MMNFKKITFFKKKKKHFYAYHIFSEKSIAATILDGFPPVGYNLEYEIPKKHSCEVWFILA